MTRRATRPRKAARRLLPRGSNAESLDRRLPGRKYKRCCLAEEKRAAREARFDDAVGGRIQEWSAEVAGEEIGAALEGYAARTDIPADEREAASRIATAKLGLHRVLAVEPGHWIVLEDIVRGTRARVRSANVSRDIATVRLEGAELHVEAMSRERLELAIEAIEADFGDIAKLVKRDTTPIEERLDERSDSEPGDDDSVPFALRPAEERRLLTGFMTDHIRGWLDEPLPALGGQTPREAAAGEQHDEVIRLVRGIENGAERARRRGEPGAEVSWLRAELAIDDELAA